MKRSFFILPIFLLIMLMFLNCPADQTKNDEDDTTPVKRYVIGSIGPSGVGIVFYITDGGLHGLEAAPSDQGASLTWSNIIFILLGTTGTAIGTGMANSNAIISQDEHTESAAKVCRDYRGGGLTDWFLPSKDELNQLYLQRIAIGEFANDNYWSSSEYSEYHSWYQHFNNGIQVNDVKYLLHRVRAVRAF